jgi:hypothetical protein
MALLFLFHTVPFCPDLLASSLACPQHTRQEGQ